MVDGWKVAAVVLLSLCSAFVSAALASVAPLDVHTLEIMISLGGSDGRAARSIMPLRKQGNLLIASLVLANVFSNALLAIMLADLTSVATGFLIASFLIVTVGELLPQTFQHFGGTAFIARTKFIIYAFMLVMFPLAFPISKLLDYFLKEDLGLIYSKSEFKKLVEINQRAEVASGMSKTEARLLNGVLELANKQVRDVMTPMADVFMLEANTLLNRATIARILENGHSRIPIYEFERNNIIGLLLVKDLIMQNPDNPMTIKAVLKLFRRTLIEFWSDEKLDACIARFTSGHGHMGLVRHVNTPDDGDPFYENVGIFTLEDLIEEILMEEIIDEYDTVLDNKSKQKVKGKRTDYQAISKLAGGLIDPAENEVRAVASYLLENVPEFRRETSRRIKEALSTCPVQILKPGTMIYKAGQTARQFTLILHGKVEVVVGSDGFVSQLGSFCTMGAEAMSHGSFTPSFSARAVLTTHIVQLSSFDKAVSDADLPRPTFKKSVSLRYGGTRPSERLEEPASDEAAPAPPPAVFSALRTARRGFRPGLEEDEGDE